MLCFGIINCYEGFHISDFSVFIVLCSLTMKVLLRIIITMKMI